MRSLSPLLAKVHAALPPRGTLLLAEPMAGTPGAEPVGDAYFGLYLRAMGSGQPRTAARLTALLRRAGFHAGPRASDRNPGAGPRPVRNKRRLTAQTVNLD